MTPPSTPCVIVSDGVFFGVYGLRGDRWTQFRAPDGVRTKKALKQQLAHVASVYGPRVKFKQDVDFRTDWKANDGWPDKIDPKRLQTEIRVEDLL